MTATHRVRRAKPDDMTAILDLINWSAKWLREYKNTDQWARPWPNKRARDARVRQGIEDGLTWMVEDHQSALVGTVTYREKGSPKLWTRRELREPAVYVSRLIVARDYADQQIGSALLDWAGQRGMDRWGAMSIRVDVWTTNHGLHAYYVKNGFSHLRTLEFWDNWKYPFAAIFQKPVDAIDTVAAARFKEVSPCDGWPVRSGDLPQHGQLGPAKGRGLRRAGPHDRSSATPRLPDRPVGPTDR
jgi:ribosomal protein S18 acetylase RimI-like enzyme